MYKGLKYRSPGNFVMDELKNLMDYKDILTTNLINAHHSALTHVLLFVVSMDELVKTAVYEATISLKRNLGLRYW